MTIDFSDLVIAYENNTTLIDRAATIIHNKWIQRNPWADEELHVNFYKLPKDEQDKDRLHVHLILQQFKQGSTIEEQVVNNVASIFHEQWRTGYKQTSNGKPRMKRINTPFTDEKGNVVNEVNIDVEWNKLNDEWKHDNRAAAKAAYDAVINAYNVFKEPVQGGRSDKFRILGRERKIYKDGRKSYIIYLKQHLSLAEARKLDKELIKQKKQVTKMTKSSTSKPRASAPKKHAPSSKKRSVSK